MVKAKEALRVAKLHSEVGASGRQRWAVCAGSRKLIRTLPKHPSSPAAQWGTDAHEHAEQYLRHVFEGAPKPPRIVDEEMRECVKAYVEKCGELLDQYTEGRRLAARIWIEATFTLPGMPEAYGTVDFLFYVPETKRLVCVDLKTGTGYMVSAIENPQLLYYATGAMFQEFLEVAHAVLAISQPRGMDGHEFTDWHVPGMRLFDELAKLRAEILATEKPDAPLVSGDHCAKSFCPALAVCPERKQEAYAIAQLDFAPLVTYQVDDLVRLFKAIPRIKAACEAVNHFLHAEAYAGRVPAGLKLVNKRLGNRQWKDEMDAGQKLVELGLAEDDLVQPWKLKSPAQIEKLLPKGVEIPEDLTVRESSGTTLVAESDDRPAAVLDGVSDFAPVTQKG